MLVITAVAQLSPKEKIIHQLLVEIRNNQIKSNGFYFKGSFPSLRYNGNLDKAPKEDNNMFFTGLIAFSLKELEPRLQDSTNRNLCETITTEAQQAFLHFQHISGRPTYNFWGTNPVQLFPGSKTVQLLKKINSLPDDLDDTAIRFLSQDNVPDSTLRKLEELMVVSANGNRKRVKNTFRKYKYIPAYSTWFGAKMPVDFDFCVLTNILYFRHIKGYAPNATDSATIQLLAQMIAEKEYIKHPSYISPHYGRTPILLYHIARLMGKFELPELLVYKEQILQDIATELQHPKSAMDALLLHISQIWLGKKEQKTFFAQFDFQNLYSKDFTFFVAGFQSYFNNPLKNWLKPLPFIRFYFQCPDYNKVLLIQYLSLLD